MAFYLQKSSLVRRFLEQLIGLTKSTLKKVLGRTHATLESLQTMIVEVESVLKNRLLTYVSPDANEIEPITPSYLLYGRQIVSLPHYDVQFTNPTYGEKTHIKRSTKVHVHLHTFGTSRRLSINCLT